jgi:imidazolonepropionase-like amidohydrolase
VRELGAAVTVSSDADGEHTRLDRFAYSVEAFRLGMEITFAEALHAATGLAARAIGMADQIGSLAPALLADVLVVDGDPAEDISAMMRVRRVLLAGRSVVSSGGIMYAIDDEKALQET